LIGGVAHNILLQNAYTWCFKKIYKSLEGAGDFTLFQMSLSIEKYSSGLLSTINQINFISKDGSHYTGQYTNGVEEGPGTIIYSDGNILVWHFHFIKYKRPVSRQLLAISFWESHLNL
jgi:hypothetical protein